MKSITFEERMALTAKKNGFELIWQPLKFGFQRAVFNCDSFGEMTGIERILGNMTGVAIDRWLCTDGGVFEGVVYAMDANEKEELDRKLTEEWNRLEDWWQRYHVADDETRRLMACGAIA